MNEPRKRKILDELSTEELVMLALVVGVREKTGELPNLEKLMYLTFLATNVNKDGKLDFKYDDMFKFYVCENIYDEVKEERNG